MELVRYSFYKSPHKELLQIPHCNGDRSRQPKC